jgi:hypothetical protein
MRDFHHPDGTLTDKTEKVDKWTKFNRFILALLNLWLKSEDEEVKKVYETHL